MISVDYLIANEDRHFNNFGVLRNASTLEWIGFAPIYDSGTALGYNKTARQILAHKGIKCKPFKTTHSDQLGLVKSFGWMDAEKLNTDRIAALIEEVFDNKAAEEYVGEDRIRAIIASVKKRVRFLKHFTEKREEDGNACYDADSTVKNDVRENIAEKYL